MAQNAHNTNGKDTVIQTQSELIEQYREFFKSFASIKDGKLVMHTEDIELDSDLIFEKIPELVDLVDAYDFE